MLNLLDNKRILLGVTGSIAAYKSADLVRRLRERGAEVRVVMTRAASEFITPLTLQALSGNPVRSALLDPEAEAAMGHIELARWADVVLVAPATADFIARLAQGRADDLLAALCLASDVPVALAPAMNRAMWENAATRENIDHLQQRQVVLFGPARGGQACGEVGEGRMLEPLELIEGLNGLFDSGLLSNVRVLVSAGPTREAIDPVRYITNRSSGRMGYAVAAAAVEAGARVTLVSGPVALATPQRVERVDVESARQMHAAVMAHAAACDIYIATAAVSDFSLAAPLEQKIKKEGATEELQLVLQRTPDILASVAGMERAPFTVGFAAETEQLLEYASHKLASKGLDMIAANRVGADLGFEKEENSLEVLWAGGHVSLPLTSKEKLARSLMTLVAENYYAKSTTEDS